MTKNNTGIVT